MGSPEGFEYATRGDDVVITHHGRPATTLRGRKAQDFLEDVATGDPQQLMARLTGNFKRGNERAGNKSGRSGARTRR